MCITQPQGAAVDPEGDGASPMHPGFPSVAMGVSVGGYTYESMEHHGKSTEIMENPMKIMENPMKIIENPMKRMKIVHSLFGKYPCVKLFMALGRIITLLFRQTVREILHFFTSDMHHLTGSQPRAISSTWIWKNNCSRIVIFRRCSFELIRWSLLSSLRLAAAMQGRLEVHRLSGKPQIAIVFVLSLSLSFTVALLRV